MSIKLSPAQESALNEISRTGRTAAKSNTLKSLVEKELIKAVTWIEDQPERDYGLTTKGRAVLGLDNVEENVESLLQGDPWKLGDAITEDEAYVVLDSDGELKDAEGTEFDKFDDKWDVTLKVTAGFGATLDWRGTEVWNGLTAADIREDIETASPVNRKARRTHFRTLRNAFRRQTVQRPRKALKVTGKVGV